MHRILRLRDRLLPLVSLARLLKLKTDRDDTDKKVFIVVAQVGTYTFGIIVDRAFDTEEIVVKPVTPILHHISMFSGNTTLGNGSVIMILNPNGIAAATGESTLSSTQATESTVTMIRGAEDRTSLLIFRVAGTVDRQDGAARPGGSPGRNRGRRHRAFLRPAGGPSIGDSSCPW